MIEFKKKIGTLDHSYDYKFYYAKHFKIGTQQYDYYGKLWEVGEDVNFDKFWFREIEDKEAELVVKGFRKDD